MKERSYRLALFSGLEGGNSYWAREIQSHGAAETFQRITSGKYDPIRFNGLMEKVATFNVDAAFQSIEKN